MSSTEQPDQLPNIIKNDTFNIREDSLDIPLSTPLMSQQHLSNSNDSFDLTPDESDSTRPASASSFSSSSTSSPVLGALLTKKLHSFNQFFWQNLGLFLIILSQFFNSTMVVTTKLLVKDPEFADDPIHPAQILFVRMIITALGCYLYLRYVMKMDQVFGPPEIRIWLVARGVAGFFGVFSIYYSLMYLSVSDAVTITFLVPSVTGFLAWVCLREKWSLMEAGGGLISLVGVLLISRPSFIFGTHTGSGNDQVESSDPKERLIGTLVGLVGVVGASSVYIVIRKIRGKVHSLITVQYFAISCVFITLTALLVVPGLSFKLPRSAKQWALFFGLGISGFCMQFLLTEGIMREKASRASSMLYVQIIYSIFWEIVIWGHVPGFSSVCGIVIILGAAFVVIYYKPKESEESPKPAADLESGSVRLEDYPAATQSRG